jgi:hypothetical protein
MEDTGLPDWESLLVDEAVRDAESKRRDEKKRAQKRALQLAREQAYHRLALAITRPKVEKKTSNPRQLTLWPQDPTLFDEPA